VSEGRPLLRIASYNVHRCIGTDGGRDLVRIARVIHELAADVIALQEVEGGPDPGATREPLAFLARATGFVAVPGAVRSDHRGDYGNALLTRFPVRSARSLDLSVAGREPRGAIDVTVDLDDGRARIIATHLGLRGRERRVQIERLLLAASSLVDGPPILIGDFNEWRRRSSLVRSLGARFGGFAAPATFPSWRPILALDRIWVGTPWVLHAVIAHRSPLARVASDHLPLVAALSRP
jgi:endonuclease/exonuclease/phosphatase family metal-dependent hydrolase